ncbi:hypothetical protein GGX14DRAFT_358074 [Mycena pura]|uniref:MYND-type domain-containing protein n=1 Tax=Mycena pura TaxID=153505 RepID=A0AAD6VMH0_9AGAR|nr:hypothetical protein GGX14DRAFT_358074 [Mycena pura]
MCSGCRTQADISMLKQCSGCGAVLYCSQKCQRLDWNGKMMESIAHKSRCSKFKAHLLRLDTVQSVIKSFPWGRVEADGTFYDDCARAQFYLLGGAGFGFWSQSGMGLFEEAEDDEFIKNHRMKWPAFDEHWRAIKQEKAAAQIDFMNGQDLLKATHLNDKDGWKLPPDLLVRRDFTATARSKAPHRVRSLICNWDDWHAWRNVPKSSPASLLMHYPLTIYWILCHTLKLASVGADAPNERVHLTVHYIGAEVELNFIPILSELALLLPHHDLDIVLFGPCVFYLGQKGATDAHRTSLISRSAHDGNIPIFTYDAPDSCGSGRVRVFLHTASKYWNKKDLPTYGKHPDAILACNAGLFTYDASHNVVHASLEDRIPFAITDYQEYMLESNRDTVVLRSLLLGNTHLNVVSRPVELNPFHQPGQRFIRRDNFAPDLVNGFILVVYQPED